MVDPSGIRIGPRLRYLAPQCSRLLFWASCAQACCHSIRARRPTTRRRSGEVRRTLLAEKSEREGAMTASVRCPLCGVQLDVPEELLGKKVRCFSCETVIDARANGTGDSGESHPAALSDQGSRE